jgi:hypothetical protein
VLPKGTAFIFGGHVWFNLSEPAPQKPQVLCVNFTSLDEECQDDECVITHVEYSWIRGNYPTTVAFSRARAWDSRNIVSCLKSGQLHKPSQGDVPANTVAKVIKAALTSRELSEELKAYIKK